MATSDHETKSYIADSVMSMALAMGDLALDMRPYWPDKSRELMGAAEIARGWANAIYHEIEGES
jgi:hypothetical protein